MLRRLLPWREAAWAFLLSRAVVLVVYMLSVVTFPTSRSAIAPNCAQELKRCLLVWNQWDTHSYLAIAHDGYQLARLTVFFPLWPLSIRGVGTLFGGSLTANYFAALFLANLFFFLALVVAYALFHTLYDDTIARNALWCLACYPYAMFFSAGYTESLFLLLSLGTFYCLQLKRMGAWWIAGILGGLASATRATGLVLMIPFFIFFLQSYWLAEKRSETTWRQKILALLPILLIPLGLALYLLYLSITWNNPLIFSVQESIGWKRQLALPWEGTVNAVAALFQGYYPQLNTPDLVFTFLPLGVLLAGWRRLPLAYSLYALTMALFSLSHPVASHEPLNSMPRYMLVVFPIFIILGAWCKNIRFERLYNAIALPLLAIFTVLFVSHYWLA